jgi:hypothetical protein
MATIATAAARCSSPTRRHLLTRRRLPFCVSFSSATPPAAMAGFGWADALRVAGDGGCDNESDLTGYFRKVDTCNRGMVSSSRALTCVRATICLCSANASYVAVRIWVGILLQDNKGEFVKFLVEDQVVGYIHKG